VDQDAARGVFDRYPQLRTLRGLVPDEVVEREIAVKGEAFEHWRRLAEARIPTVKLNQVFPAELERGRVVLENFLGQWGNVSVEELCKIRLIARYLRPRAVFEFGTFNGCTALQLAMNTPDDCRQDQRTDQGDHRRSLGRLSMRHG